MNESRIAYKCVCCENEVLDKSPAILMPFVAHRAFGWAPVEITEEWGLSSIKPGMAYSICNSVICKQCHHLFLDIRFSEKEMQALYEGYRGDTYNQLRAYYEPTYPARNEQLKLAVEYLDYIEKFLLPIIGKPKSILDWGGDTGMNTPFRSAAEHHHVFDISGVQTVQGARPVKKEDIDTFEYDLIVSMHVLEHIPYPQHILEDIKSSMSDKTVLYIEVPFENHVLNSQDYSQMHLSKKYWHEHINFYTESSLRALIESAGLDVIKLEVGNVLNNGADMHILYAACKKR